MKRRFAIALLAAGTLFGYGSGIAHIVHAHHAHCGALHAAPCSNP